MDTLRNKDITGMLTLQNKYTFYSTPIGKGSYSKVYQGYEIDQITKKPILDTPVAIKIVKSKLGTNMTERVFGEIKTMERCDHENVLKLKSTFHDSANIFIVSEFCNGTLGNIINREMSEDEIKWYFTQIRNGFKYLHSLNIVHRDIKPQNLLITYINPQVQHGNYKNINLKIADFGFSRMFETEEDMFATLCGSPNYISPEILQMKKASVKSDLWSLGVVLFQMIYKSMPYGKCNNILELHRNMDREIVYPKSKNKVSDELLNLLKNLLQKDISKRLDWGEFFSHPWFDDSDIINDDLRGSIVEDIHVNTHIQVPHDTAKINKNVEMIDDYCDRFRGISIPVNIPMRKISKSYPSTFPLSNIHSFSPPLSNSLNYVYNNLPFGTSGLYKIMTSSVENIKERFSY
jgi:serine/threonine protein kinase